MTMHFGLSLVEQVAPKNIVQSEFREATTVLVEDS